jgi:translocation and assembly module TamB
MKWRRWLLALAVLLVVVAATVVALGTAPVLRSLAGSRLAGLEGSLWAGLNAAELQGQQAGLNWQAQGVQVAPLRWAAGGVQTRIQIQRLSLQISSTGGPPLTQEALLAALRLPVALHLTRVEVAQLEVNGQTLDTLDFELRVGGPDPLLSLPKAKAKWQGAALSASAELGARGQLALALQGQREALQLQLQGKGTLAKLPLSLRLMDGQLERLSGQVELAPLAAQPLMALQAKLQGLNPQALHAQAPLGDWLGQLQIAPTQGPMLQLKVQAQNLAARRLDEGGWPLRSVALQLQLDPAQWQQLQIEQLELALGSQQQAAGSLQLQPLPRLPQAGQALQTRIELRGVKLQSLSRDWPALQLGGSLDLTQAKASLEAPMDWRTSLKTEGPGEPWRLEAHGRLQGQKLELTEAQLRQAQARIQLQGEAEQLPSGWRTEGQAQVDQLSLRLAPWSSPSRLQAGATWTLQRRAGVHTGELSVTLAEGNQLAGQPVTGTGLWQAGAEAARWQLSLLAGQDAKLDFSGRQAGPLRDVSALALARSWQPETGQWQVPDLSQLQPLWQPWLRQLAGSSQGSLTLGAKPQLSGQVQQLRLQRDGQALLTLQRLQAKLDDGRGQLALDGLQFGAWQLNELRASGAPSSVWQVQAQGALKGAQNTQSFSLQAQSQAPLQEAAAWRLPGLTLTLGPSSKTPAEASAWLALSQAELLLQLPPAPQAWSLQLRSPQAFRLLGEPLQLDAAQWSSNGSWQLAMQGKPQLAPWLEQLEAQSSWQGDARAAIQLRASQAAGAGAVGSLEVGALTGDLQLDGQALGLTQLSLQADQQPSGASKLVLQVSSKLLGELEARLAQSAQTALSGSVKAQLPQLKTLRAWLPGGVQLEGSAKLDALLGGTREAPRLRGNAELQLTRLQHPSSGLGGQMGLLKAQFNEDRLEVTELSMQGQGEAGGSLSGSGALTWKDSLQAKLDLKADKLRLLNRFDRRLSLSGTAKLAFSPEVLRLQGDLTADSGVFEIGRSDAPELDADVSVVRAEDPPAAATSARKGPRREVDLKFDLGQRLRVQGRGFASRLTGQLQVKESGGKPAQWLGQIETQGGRYKAYGQVLDLETGEVRFTGSLDNPRLDLLAIRPNIEHRVGVSVTGTAQQPRVRLYAEPDLPDNDKLAWLLLGRDPSEVTGRDTALLQRAALALLSGEGDNPASQLMDRLGITELSVGQGEDAGTVLRLGAQLSRRWSVGYERSLNATSGSWQLVYRLGQRFRLRAQSGTDSAVDLLWLWRFD